MTYWATSLSSPSSFSRPALNKQIQKPIQSWHVGQLRNNEQDANLFFERKPWGNKMLTLAGLRGLLLDGRQLVLDRGQLLLEGLLGPSSACKESRSKIQYHDLAYHQGLA
jgi:hypothetical protein